MFCVERSVAIRIIAYTWTALILQLTTGSHSRQPRITLSERTPANNYIVPVLDEILHIQRHVGPKVGHPPKSIIGKTHIFFCLVRRDFPSAIRKNRSFRIFGEGRQFLSTAAWSARADQTFERPHRGPGKRSLSLMPPHKSSSPDGASERSSISRSVEFCRGPGNRYGDAPPMLPLLGWVCCNTGLFISLALDSMCGPHGRDRGQ